MEGTGLWGRCVPGDSLIPFKNYPLQLDGWEPLPGSCLLAWLTNPDECLIFISSVYRAFLCILKNQQPSFSTALELSTTLYGPFRVPVTQSSQTKTLPPPSPNHLELFQMTEDDLCQKWLTVVMVKALSTFPHLRQSFSVRAIHFQWCSRKECILVWWKGQCNEIQPHPRHRPPPPKPGYLFLPLCMLTSSLQNK